MKHKRKIFILGGVLFIFCAIALFFKLRSPVLLVTDEPFILLYGKRRTQIQQVRASFALGRRVQQVIVADTAGSDLLVLALEEAAARPWCAVFPHRYGDAARRYHEQFPEINTILLSGRAGPLNQQNPQIPDDEQLFFDFSTDEPLDAYRAGRFALIFCGEENGNVPVFMKRNDQFLGKDAFLNGFSYTETEAQPRFYETFSQLTLNEEFPVAVIAGSGYEYLDKNPLSPVILYTWLDPAFTSREIQVIMDDSVWAQLPDAVKLVKQGQKTGQIPSRPLIFSRRIADNGVLQDLKKAARSGMEQNPDEP